MQAMWDSVVAKGIRETQQRKTLYDRGKVERHLNVGDLVMCWIPGLCKKLHDPWEGPFRVESVLSAVNYKVKEVQGKERMKTIHINNAKRYVEREREVCTLTVVAEDRGLGESKVKLKESVGRDGKNKIAEVLEEFKEQLDEFDGKYTGGSMSIELEADAKVISQKPYRIPDSLQQSVKQAVDKLLAEGKAEPSKSVWASPIVPVPKPDGSTRLCVDYWKINAVTPQIRCPIKQLDDILGQVGKAKVLSKLDLQSGIHQTLLEEDSRDFTTFVTPWGKYRFTVMPFGLKNAPAVFQSIMDDVLRDCATFAVVYIDDILIFSDSMEEHLNHITEVMKSLKKAGLKVKAKLRELPQAQQWKT